MLLQDEKTLELFDDIFIRIIGYKNILAAENERLLKTKTILLEALAAKGSPLMQSVA